MWNDIRCTAGSVSSKSREGSSVYTSNTALLVQPPHDVEHTVVLRSTLALALNLQKPTQIVAKRKHAYEIGQTCSRTLARSTGAATKVCGMAEMKPATAYSVVLSAFVSRSGVAAKMIFWPRSYPWRVRAIGEPAA